ncbi:MAG TPA: hypothetical protein ENJ82_05550 [Bacteroidetes bacterium]|nr:hypothetical protein [Bacteroidota bacterium]
MNIALSDLYGKKFALLIWYMTEDQETRAATVSGIAFMHKGQLSLHRGNILPPLSIPLQMVWRARCVPEDLKDILHKADYCIQGTITELGLVRRKEDFFC